MGENANVSWDWHNTVVGQGYQARGVVRQAGAVRPGVTVVDMRAAPEAGQKEQHSMGKESKKHDKEREKHSHKKSSKREKRAESAARRPAKMFNPLLQGFAASLSDTTRSFTVH